MIIPSVTRYDTSKRVVPFCNSVAFGLKSNNFTRLSISVNFNRFTVRFVRNLSDVASEINARGIPLKQLSVGRVNNGGMVDVPTCKKGGHNVMLWGRNLFYSKKFRVN